MDDPEVEQHKSARHLDDPTPILGGLSFLQLLGVMIGLGMAFELYRMTAFMGGVETGVIYYLRWLIIGVPSVLVMGGMYLQFKGKVEPFVVQMIGFALRPHRYRSRGVDRARYSRRTDRV